MKTQDLSPISINSHVGKMGQWFERFSIQTQDSPMYAMISKRISEDYELLEKIPNNETQPVPNLFLASVNYLLVKNQDQDLAQYYPNYGGKRSAKDLYPTFRDFCFSQMDKITVLMATRLVQTNEVGRCALLLPAVAIVSSQTNETPLHLIDVGASSGLNLLMDQYFIRYSDGTFLGRADSSLQLSCQITGKPPVQLRLPTVSTRTGIDLNSVDLTNEDEVLWTRSLIWADQADRIERFDKAVSILRQNPPNLTSGTALEKLKPVIAGIPPKSAVCILHSFTMNQFSTEDRARFEALLASASLTHEIWRISLEWLGTENPELAVEHFLNGRKQSSKKLADCHQHGAWIRW